MGRRKKNKLTSSSKRSGEPFSMTEKLQNENIEILKEELDFAARHVERCQYALERAIELATAAKRDLDRVMEEKRRFTRMKLHAH
ncbi:MAG TPA: hypothetical protein VFR94_06200 [Nitrososphaeraceae archaeon]|nr:hypothetical protein [Nitrososphaeraceae archaeon]